MYPDPERFNPDRFLKNGRLDPDVRDPMAYAFGFGRRYDAILHRVQVPQLTVTI